MNTVYLSLGSNMGDRLEMLQDAVRLLMGKVEIRVTRVSSVYETTAVGYTDQAEFLNMVIEIQTELSAKEILVICLEVEQSLGRKREFKWGPRCIDLDILLYNDENIVSENLIIPHPRMLERGFVLIPLVELIPNGTHPESGVNFNQYMEKQKEGVYLWKTFDGADAFVHSGS